MSNVLLITDQHFGVRNDNQNFVEKYRQFYNNVVIPAIDEYSINRVICLGDTFDKRKSINFASLDAAKEMWFQPLWDRRVQMLMLCGNHDIYYKNTLKVNAPKLLLNEYDNIDVIDEPCDTCAIGDHNMLLLPWICDENRQQTMKMIQETDATVCMGHLELNGFEAIPGHRMEHGDDPSLYSKFDLVCSGHFHMKSRKNQINYLGNPYQLYWNDYGQKRGCHILNTKTLDLKFIPNPYNIFNKVYYKDDIHLSEDDLSSLEGSYVKLVVESKEDQVKFDKVVRLLQGARLADLKIIEDISYELDDVGNDIEIEDTLTILETCVSEFQNKDAVFGILKSLYLEALEV